MDIWKVVRVVKLVEGFSYGVLQYIYSAYLFIWLKSVGFHGAINVAILFFILNQVLILLSEVPTGAIGDCIGRKKSVILACIFASLSLALKVAYPFIGSTTLFLVIAILTTVFGSISYAFYSGSFVAWIVDSLHEKERDDLKGELLSHSFEYRFSGQLIGALLTLSLFMHQLTYLAIFVCSVLEIFCSVYCIKQMKETHSFTRGKRERSIKQLIIISIGIFREHELVFMTAISWALFVSVTNLTNYLWPIALKETFDIDKTTVEWFFIILASISMLLVGSKLSRKLQRKFYQNRSGDDVTYRILWNIFLIGICLFTILVLLFGILIHLGVNSIYVYVILIPLFRIGYGFMGPIYQTLINHFIPKDHSTERATILSVSSMLMLMFNAIFLMPGMFFEATKTPIAWIFPSSLTLVVALLCFYISKSKFHRRKP